MADTSKSVDDSLYNDDIALNANAYAYGPNDPPDSQWLYNDQALAVDQNNTDTVTSNADASNSANFSSGTVAPAALSDAQSGGKDDGKLFVGGLSWETDENKLHEYFSKYGNIIQLSILRDATTGRPRGFGFVTFESIDGVNAVLKEPTHVLDGKHIDPKHAIPRESQPSQPRQSSYDRPTSDTLNAGAGGGGNNDSFVDPVKEMKGDKIFVGGLPPSATDADLNSSFIGFGNIVETKLMMDRETGRSRGYGFLQFEGEQAALLAVTAGNSSEGIQIHGKRVDVKPAVHKKRAPMMNMGMPGYNMMGMMGMPNYNMMGMMGGMPGYGMMGMPGYGMMGANGQNPGVDYSNTMGYGEYYGNMAGYYNAGGGEQGDGSGAGDANDGAIPTADANGYYGQMNMPMGFYGTDGQGDGTVANNQNAEQTGKPYYDQQSNNDTGSGNKNSGRYSDNRGSRDRGGRDSSHRSSSRRHGNNDGRSGRERSRGDHNNNRNRDEYRGSRGSRQGRDRDGPVRGSHGSSSRSHGYNPY
ncbi:RNA-binding domain-containing protein [Coemansia reversa NRRL 1564]|uniref:RNA-binding domain-containing protein n=1 Tax=Coemansia reversa (strain ATCC 12441 / NRRL 1564) TaxID=763665 RepID=A0A2G5BAT0_COERN|nr:RNA-binding domain-containing protein [Coemansia reversa NRRL 1564]|eukprot:PIA16110.1 RNA-binding domain-containing protein [Coemansia reversa NRRL 1564]